MTHNGETKTLTEWSRLLNIHHKTISDRIDKSGWTVAEALETPPLKHQHVKIEFRGERKNLCDWAKTLGIQRETLYCRINRYGWSLEKAFTTPVKHK